MLLAATQFIHALQARQGVHIACLEEIAFSAGWIGAEQVERCAGTMKNSEYGRYLLELIAGNA